MRLGVDSKSHGNTRILSGGRFDSRRKIRPSSGLGSELQVPGCRSRIQVCRCTSRTVFSGPETRRWSFEQAIRTGGSWRYRAAGEVAGTWVMDSCGRSFNSPVFNIDGGSDIESAPKCSTSGWPESTQRQSALRRPAPPRLPPRA